MTNKFPKKIAINNTKATARIQRYYSKSDNDNETNTQVELSSKSSPPSLEKLDRATNSQGEVFEAGDLIQIRDLRNLTTTAYIKYFYEEPRGTMAVYSPAEELDKGWLWEKGFCFVDSLIRA